MNREVITLEDCIDNYEKRGRSVVIEDGKVSYFVEDGNDGSL
mgnify:CR=1 FL=1